MNLLYNTDFQKSTIRGTLVVAPTALALIVMLLWFGSIRNPDPLSADKAELYSACLEGSFAPCADATLRIRAFTPASPENDNDASGAQHVLNGGIKSASLSSNTEFPATTTDKDIECTISGGWSCLPESSSSFDTQRAETGETLDVQFPGAASGVLVPLELRTY